MTRQDPYKKGVHRAWLGERGGEVFFTTLAEHTADTGFADKCRTLAQLESCIGHLLEPLLEEGENLAPDTQSSREAGVQLGGMTVEEALLAMRPVIEGAVPVLQALADQAPDAHKQQLQLLADHEVALKRFVDLELADEGDQSMALVEEVIGRARDLG